MDKIRVLSVFGTRPEAIKMAPLVLELQNRPEFVSMCCLTGQHRQMLDSVMEIFELKAEYDLDIMEKQQTLSTITTKTILGMDKVLGGQARPGAGPWRYFYHLRRRSGGLLPPGHGGSCGGRSSHLRYVFPLPRGDEPDPGG